MKNNDGKLVSVLVPYYKGKQFVEEAIISINEQTYKNIEIIVVNDSPEDVDSTQYIIDLQKKYGFKLIHHEHNLGLTKALLTGFKNSNGEYIELLSQDDLFVPEKTEKQVNIFEENEDIVYVSGLIETYNISKNTRKVPNISKTKKAMKEGKIFPALYKSCCFNGMYGQACMVRREIIEKDFTPLWSKLTADVWPIKIMLFEKYPNQIYLQDEVVTIYRIHNENTIGNPYKMLALNAPTVAEMIPEKYRKQALYGILKYVGINMKSLTRYKILFFIMTFIFLIYFIISSFIFLKYFH